MDLWLGCLAHPLPLFPLRNTMEARPACALKDVYQEALGSAVIGIDEGQFVSVWPGQGLGCALLDLEQSTAPSSS